MEQRKLWIFAVLVLVSVSGIVGEVKEERTPDGKSSMKIKAPILSAEEIDSTFIPAHMKCDGCLGVAFQIFLGLTKAQSKRPKTTLPESEVLDAFETICSIKPYEMYTLKDVDGKNMLSGPGIEKEAKGPSMMQGGGLWPGRMMSICGDFLDMLGEDDMYAQFRKVDGDIEKFGEYLCYGPASGGKFCKSSTETADPPKDMETEKQEL